MKATWLTRLVKLERAQDGGDWHQGTGLSSLLRMFPAEADADTDGEPPDVEGSSGLARLLAEARAAQAGAPGAARKEGR